MNILEYKIHSELGKGGMATVYLAEDEKFKHSVAIKVLNKEFVHNDNIRKRFLSEARNIFKMSHPNIIKVSDLIDEGDTVAFVMEYIEGQTLKEHLDTKGKLNEEEIKRLFAQMLEAVGYVHEQGLIHRDIKPSNFMISSKGVVKLLDFGIAKNTDTTSAEYTQTGTTQNMGTPMYMSPEQVKSTKEVTAQSDIYSLGVVLWQMVTGKKPYDTNTISTFELQTKIINDALSKTSTIWDDLIQKATKKDYNDRFFSCQDFYNSTTNVTKKDFNVVDDKTIINPSTIFEKTVTEKVIQGTNQKIADNSKIENNWKAIRLICVASSLIGLFIHFYWFIYFNFFISFVHWGEFQAGSYFTLLILILMLIYLRYSWQRRNENFNHKAILVSGGLILIAFSFFNFVYLDMNISFLRWIIYMLSPPLWGLKIIWLLYHFSLIFLIITPLFLKRKSN